jgi:subtilisin family serine protease
MSRIRQLGATLLLAASVQFAAPPAAADAFRLEAATASTNVLRGWMSPEIGDAWRQGFTGRGTTITVIDDFRRGAHMRGNLGTGLRHHRHGEWTRLQARMVAPGAAIRSQDFSSTSRVALARGLNVLNLSYGMMGPAGWDASRINWSPREASIIGFARSGQAVISKAAGNDAVAVGATNRNGMRDYLNAALIGAPSAMFVGALDRNGRVAQPAALASYSNFAGADSTVQNQFLVVGVEAHRTGLHGTSFAAPIVSGYSAILGSKFRSASPTQITERLLSTARTDTIQGYDPALHGRGEASLSRALAPVSIR